MNFQACRKCGLSYIYCDCQQAGPREVDPEWLLQRMREYEEILAAERNQKQEVKDD